MANEVLETTQGIIDNPQYVKIDDIRVLQLAKEWEDLDFKLPTWDFPVYLPGKTNEVIDFFFLNNSINFAFTDFETKEKFSSFYDGQEWRGALGMTAGLRRAVDDGMPILEGEFLKDISEEDMREILQGEIEIPMFKERHEIFKEVGRVLTEKYDGHFNNLMWRYGSRLFFGGDGLVEKIVEDFPSFDDSVIYEDKQIVFNKRAQLAAGMIYERFGPSELDIEDIDDITVFADYVLPKGLRDLGVLKYEDSLAQRVDNQEVIPAGSREELEIRASTIHVANDLVNEINLYREAEGLPPINALHMDAHLWFNSRSKNGHPHHLTKTIAY